MPKVKVSDYLIRRIADLGIKDIFMVTGGGAMHLDDSIRREARLKYTCNHHEQASAMAAEGYARVTGGLAAVCVTTGPGGTNTLTGLLGQWHDSVPVIYISGQVKYETTVASTGLPLRQLGDQEGPIIEIVKPVSKYAVMVTDPKSIRYHFEKAVHLAQQGRPGPVWLDIPLNVQAALVEEDDLEPFLPDENQLSFDKSKVREQIGGLIEKLKQAERPVILAGSAIRIDHATEDFLALARKLSIPVLTAWNAPDLIDSDDPLFFGRPSTIGDRGGNFIIQNSDLMLSLGCRLNVRQIGYEFKSFARAAYRVIVDIDADELKKPTIFPDMPIQSGVKFFIETLTDELKSNSISPKESWLAWCRERARRYPVVLPEYHREKDKVNPYVFIEELSKSLDSDAIVVTGNGAASVVTFQAVKVKYGQRYIANSGTAAMGYDLPCAIGASISVPGRPVVCLAGDGSLQMNIQELETVAYHQLPIKIFVFNNGGYLSIRQTQDNLFGGNYIGEGPDSGVGFPNITKIAKAYGLDATRIEDQSKLGESINQVLGHNGPIVCDVMMPVHQTFSPKVASERLPDGTMISKPLEDMYPFLDRDEFKENMIIPSWD